MFEGPFWGGGAALNFSNVQSYEIWSNFQKIELKLLNYGQLSRKFVKNADLSRKIFICYVLLCPRCLKLCRCCGTAWKNGVWEVYWVAVKSSKRLGGGIECNEEAAVKEWEGRPSVERSRRYAGEELEGFG